jgi:hypothetical protein
VYEDANTERLLLQYYNLYRKLIYRGHLVDSEFLYKRAQRNDFFLVGNEEQVQRKYERIMEALEPDGIVFQVNYGGMPLRMVKSQIRIHAQIANNCQGLRTQA